MPASSNEESARSATRIGSEIGLREPSRGERPRVRGRRVLPKSSGATGRRRSIYLHRPSPSGRDVFCAGMYRACSTWQYEVVAHLVEERWHGERLGYLSAEGYAARDGPFSRLFDRGGQGLDRGAWRALKSHEGGRSFAHALRSGRALAVYAYRDLRDVVFSLMRKRAVSFQELLRQGMIHQLLANDAFWRAQPRVLIQRYEDLIVDPVTGVLQIARHLGLGLTRGEAADIADLYSIASNQARINSLRQRLHNAGIDLTNPINRQVCDPTALLHWNHLGPSDAGSWRNHASARQAAVLIRVCGDWLERNGYGYESERDDITTTNAAGARCFFPLVSFDLVVGQAVFWMRAAASLCPWGSRIVKRLVRMRSPEGLASIAWNRGESLVLSDSPSCRGAKGCEGIPA